MVPSAKPVPVIPPPTCRLAAGPVARGHAAHGGRRVVRVERAERAAPPPLGVLTVTFTDPVPVRAAVAVIDVALLTTKLSDVSTAPNFTVVACGEALSR